MNDVTPIAAAHKTPPRSGETYEAALDDMAGEFRRLTNAKARGELAALRRLDPEHPSEGAFFRLLARAVPDHLLGRSNGEAGAPGSRLDMIQRWALVAAIMAQRPDALHRGRLGQSLKAIGYSEQRLDMLLTARGFTFRDLARRAARRLARSDGGVPHRELGRLVLLDSRDEYDAEAEELRIRIAMDFQRAPGPEAGSDDDTQSD
jgi:hypothetical protein